MEQDSEVFTPVLKQDERILFFAKPNRRRMVFVNSLALSIYFILFGIAFLIWGIVVSLDTPSDSSFYGLLFGIGALFLLFFPLIIALNQALYRKTYYAVTTERILIRSGVVGIDYKSLDIATIGSVNVNVNFLDKCMQENTGSVTFASSSIPVTSNGVRFGFYHLDCPYDAYRAIKELIDRQKKAL